MMAVILFLFLLTSSAANASTEFLNLDQYNITGIEQPLFDKRLNLKGQKRVSYRGNIKHLINNTVCILNRDSGDFGAGVVLDHVSVLKIMPELSSDYLHDRSFIVTNFHVVESGEIPEVLFMSEDSLDLDSGALANAEVISTVPEKDLALLMVRSTPKYIVGASIISSSGNNIGDEVEAIGHPSGMMWTYTKGYISQIRTAYEWSYNDSFTMSADVIQTQTPISTGSSGGPLFNNKGELIGINTMISTDGQNLNFSVSSEEFIHLKAGFDYAVEIDTIKEGLYWDSFHELFYEGYVEKERGKLDDEQNYQVYSVKSDPSVGFLAVFRDTQELSFIYIPYDDEGKSYDLYFSPKHSNDGALFKVSVYLDEELIAEGWDFDGDFEVDYVL